MSTFVGHALAATVLVSSSRSRIPAERYGVVLALAVFAAALPDIDVFLHAGSGVGAHRGLTHTLLFALTTAAALTAVARAFVGVATAKLFLVMFLACVSHLLLDFLMGAGPPVRPFAPFYDRGFLAPARLLPIAYYAKTAEGYRSLAFWGLNALAAALEALIFTPALISINPGWRARTRALAATLSITTLAAALAMYN